jgi:hypothetical protein
MFYTVAGKDVNAPASPLWPATRSSRFIADDPGAAEVHAHQARSGEHGRGGASGMDVPDAPRFRGHHDLGFRPPTRRDEALFCSSSGESG